MNADHKKIIDELEHDVKTFGDHFSDRTKQYLQEAVIVYSELSSNGHFDDTEIARYKRKGQSFSKFNTRYDLDDCILGLRGEVYAAVTLKRIYGESDIIPDEQSSQVKSKVDITFKKPSWERTYTGQVKVRNLDRGVILYKRDLCGSADRLVFVDLQHKRVVTIDRGNAKKLIRGEKTFITLDKIKQNNGLVINNEY